MQIGELSIRDGDNRPIQCPDSSGTQANLLHCPNLVAKATEVSDLHRSGCKQRDRPEKIFKTFLRCERDGNATYAETAQKCRDLISCIIQPQQDGSVEGH